ncbi:MAG: MBL fold metallo-hydrolase [bacterium]
MTTITFYGGVNEIGGNKILLEDEGTSIFIDFGMSFGKRAKFFSEYLNPRSFNGIGDLLITGLIPSIPGIYRHDLCRGLRKFNIQGVSPNAVILSHAHADHANYISLLSPDIPIYTGSISKFILQAMHDTTQRDLEGEIVNFREKIPGVSWQNRQIIPRNFVTFQSGNEFQIGSLKIIPFNVDHSIPDAYGFIIYTSSGAIVYTGDLRLHGLRAELTSQFVKQAANSKPIALICEGTNIEEEPGLSEEDVKEQALELISNTDKLAFVTFGGRDLDRMYTFYQVAKENNRNLVITTKQTYLLELLSQYPHHDFPIVPLDEVLIYISRKKDGIYQEKDYDKWERKYLSYSNVINASDVNREQAKIIMSLDFFQINELIDIQPAPGAYYIHSISEPFNEEMEIDAKILDNWLKHFRFTKSPMNDKHHYYYQIHASGHASGQELKELIQQINPAQLFPIHTQRPDLFQEMGVEMVKVEYGKKIHL